MAELTDARIDAALERGRTAQLHEPRAAAARYDRRSGRVIVELDRMFGLRRWSVPVVSGKRGLRRMGRSRAPCLCEGGPWKKIANFLSGSIRRS